MAAKSRKDRKEKEIILLEGQRLICDAVDAGAKMKMLYFSKVEHLEDIPLTSMDVELYKANYKQMQLFSDVATTTGLMAIAQLPKGNLAPLAEGLMPITLICDNIRDPGNLGTIIRCVAATGCKRVVLTKGCVDPWEPKVLRAGAGAHFRCHIIDGVTWQMVGNYLADDCQVFLADNNAKHSDFIEGAQFGRRMDKLMDVGSGESEEDYSDKHNGKRGSGRMRIRIMSAYDADFTQCESTIVIGGETHGLSPQAYKLAADFTGASIYLPMMPDIESMNAAMATTAILFEAKRQFLLKHSVSDDHPENEYGRDEAVSIK